MLDQFDPHDIQDLAGARQAVVHLLNLVEDLVAENRELRAENQGLRDENNRLKGEQGQPKIKPSTKAPVASGADHSSEPERRTRQPRHRRAKVAQIPVDRTETLPLDRAPLPADAEFKGYVPVVVQDVRLTTDNVRFWKEKRYSPSQQETYLAALPAGYAGEFGPGIRALVRVLYHAVNTSEPRSASSCAILGCRSRPGRFPTCWSRTRSRFTPNKPPSSRRGWGAAPGSTSTRRARGSTA